MGVERIAQVAIVKKAPRSCAGAMTSSAVLVARWQVAAFLRDPFHTFFWRDDGTAGRASGPDHLLEEAEDEAGGTGNHQDHADGVEADALNMDVGRELEDCANSD
jgi:hypothetical protein